jgi:pimeloyl-ACP methyl ester carboxylesterase
MANGENMVQVGSLKWFYREAEPLGVSDRPPVLLLHGLVSQSYSWREVLPALADQGFRAIAPDLPGCGYSDKPDRRDFTYTPDSFIQGLAAFVQTLQLERFHLVAQGFLGSVGIQYALRHPEQVDRLAIFNAPLTQTAKLPWKIQQMGLPLVGDMMTQDPLLVDRTLEGGGGYRVEDQDLDIYRRPWIKSSDAGRALLAMIQNLQLSVVTAEITAGLPQWGHPLLLGWGMRDPWLPAETAKTFAATLPETEFVELEEVGHYVQEDWHEKVSEMLLTFLKRRV